MAKFIPIIFSAFALLACSVESSTDDAALSPSHEAEVLAWRADRLSRLKAPHGYLNLAGLYWLEEGTTSFGGDSSCDIVFPGSPHARLGHFELGPDGVTMTVEADAEVYVAVGHDEAPRRATNESMLDDTTGDPTVARLPSGLSWYAINRQGRYGVRLHDAASAALEGLPPIPYYDIDPALRVTGTLRRYDQPRQLNVETVVEGLGYKPQSPGVVEFELAGQKHSLEAYESGERLFFVFGDRTSGRETYPAGRFLYAEMPSTDGQTTLDFNKAYNPPCAFNDFATCPIASPRNRLKVPVEAGEKYTKGLYMGSTAH